MPDLTENLGLILITRGQGNKEDDLNTTQRGVDSTLAGRLVRSVAGGSNVTLTDTEGRNARMELTGILTANIVVFVRVPGGTTAGYSSRRFSVYNNTTGAFTLTVKTTFTGSTGIAVTQGKQRLLEHDGTHVYGIGSEGSPTTDSWESWTPTWTNLTLGNGTVVAKYTQLGKAVFCRLSIVFGSTTSVSGDVQFTLPVTRAAMAGTASVTPIGQSTAFDTSASLVVQGCVVNFSTTKGALRVYDASGTYVKPVVTSSIVPFTWATGDEFVATFSYEAA